LLTSNYFPFITQYSEKLTVYDSEFANKNQPPFRKRNDSRLKTMLFFSLYGLQSWFFMILHGLSRQTKVFIKRPPNLRNFSF